MYLVAVPRWEGLPPLMLFLTEHPAPGACPYPVEDDVLFTPLDSALNRPRDDDEAPALLAHDRLGRDYRECACLDDLPEGFALVADVEAHEYASWDAFLASPLGRELAK
jgi:hypothetical protein